MSELIILTPQELAKRLKVPLSWVYKQKGSMPVLRCGRYLRFDWEAVVEWLRKGEHPRLEPVELKRLKAHH